jgi:hypothetical protein
VGDELAVHDAAHVPLLLNLGRALPDVLGKLALPLGRVQRAPKDVLGELQPAQFEGRRAHDDADWDVRQAGQVARSEAVAARDDVPPPAQARRRQQRVERLSPKRGDALRQLRDVRRGSTGVEVGRPGDGRKRNDPEIPELHDNTPPGRVTTWAT